MCSSFPISKLHKYMKKLHYEAHMGNNVMFNERGELSSRLYLYNLVFYLGKESIDREPIAFYGNMTEGEGLHYISQEDIKWKNGVVRSCLDSHILISFGNH